MPANAGATVQGHAPAPRDLAAKCPGCSATAEPWHIAYLGGPFATAGYRCQCSRQWIMRWADDETPEGAAALAAAGIIPDGSGAVAP